MGKIKKCKLSWKPPESDPDVDYRLYWSNVSSLSYNSNFIRLGNITEVDLPDILEAHASWGESIYLGISAVDKWGNESDIITLSEPYKLSAPEAPMDFELTPLNYYKITDPRKKAEKEDTDLQKEGADLQKQASEKTDQEIQTNNRRPASKFVTKEGKIVDGFDNRFLTWFKEDRHRVKRDL